MSLSKVKIFRFQEAGQFKEPKKDKITPLFTLVSEKAEEKQVQKKKEKEEEKEKIKELLRNAQKEAETIKKIAYEEGFKKGYQEGREKREREAEKEIETRVEPALNSLVKIIEEIKHFRPLFLSQLEKDILGLSLAIAKKIIKTEITQNREIILNNIREAIRKLTETDTINIKLNPKDYEFIVQHRPSFLEEIGQNKNIILTKDENITPGGCVIETKFSQVDATLETQWENLVYPLKKIEGK